LRLIYRKSRLLVAAAVVPLVAEACSSSSKPAATGSTTIKSVGGASSKTYTVGVLTDLTGPGSTSASTVPAGVKAGVGLAATEGYHINYVVADTGTSPAQALTAAERLVDQDHVFAVIADSSITFAAAPFLAAHRIPVVGAAVDATEWITECNMFSISGTEDFTKVYSVFGTMMKDLGVTNLASIGYGMSPSSSDVAKGDAIAAQDEGIKVGHLNANFAFGSTNAGSAVLAIKSAGSNGLISPIEQNTEFALVNALLQDGVNLKPS
jgi:ABC-type branched-subunit amino acid transport system substrate-binding protein